MPGITEVPDSVAQATLPNVIEKLREAVRPPGKRPLWLACLTDLDLVKLFYLVHRGRRIGTISKALADAGYQVEVRMLTQNLSRFKKRIKGELSTILPQGKKRTFEDKQVVNRARARLHHVEKKINDVDVLNHLIQEQLERYTFWKGLDLDASGNTEIGKQVDRLVDSIRNLVKDRFELLVKLGAVKVKPGEATRVEVAHIHALALKSIQDVQGVVELASEFGNELEALAVSAIDVPAIEMIQSDDAEGDILEQKTTEYDERKQEIESKQANFISSPYQAAIRR